MVHHCGAPVQCVSEFEERCQSAAVVRNWENGDIGALRNPS